MRPNSYLSMDMDFRVIPSTVPLHSPSPDRKSINLITPTVSPTPNVSGKANNKGGVTPPGTSKNRHGIGHLNQFQGGFNPSLRQRQRQRQRQKQNNMKNLSEQQTDHKYHDHIQFNTQSFSSVYSHNKTHTPPTHAAEQNFNIELAASNLLKQKDETIKSLRKIIDMITQNSHSRKKPIDEQQFFDFQEDKDKDKDKDKDREKQLKKEVKILTIQNQKLVNIIQKMSKSKEVKAPIENLNNTTSTNVVADPAQKQIQQQLQAKLVEITKKFNQSEHFYQEEIKQLKRFNKNLNSQCKLLQNQKKQLEEQNKRMLRIMKQRERAEGEKDKDREKGTLQSIQDKQPPRSQKLSLQKIRQQHSQNLKILKEGLIRQIQQTFDTMKIALQGINSKMSALGKRLQSIEKMTWAKFRKTHIQTESITISIRQKEGGDTLQRQIQQQGLTDRSYKIQKNKSQIYIQEGTSSSHERASRDQFTRLEEIPSQKNLKNISHPPLVSSQDHQVARLKTQLSQLRFKYQKLCLDTSSIAFSQQSPNHPSSHELHNITQQFSQLQEKYNQALQDVSLKTKQVNILYKKIEQIQTQNLEQLTKKNRQIQQMKFQISKLKNMQVSQEGQDVEKVKMLVQNYQKEIEILRKQIIVSNDRLQQSQWETQEKINAAQQKKDSLINKLQSQISLLEQYNKSLSHQLEQHTESKLPLEHQLHLSSTQSKLRNQYQQLEQKYFLEQSQLNQHKTYTATLKLQLNNRIHQFQNMKNLYIQSQDNWRKQKQQNNKLIDKLAQTARNENKDREKISRIRQVFSSSIIPHISSIQQLVQQSKKPIPVCSQPSGVQLQSVYAERNQLSASLLSTQQKLLQQTHKIQQLQATVSMYQKALEESVNRERQTVAKLSTLQQERDKCYSQLHNMQYIYQQLIQLFIGIQGILPSIANIQRQRQSIVREVLTMDQNSKEFFTPSIIKSTIIQRQSPQHRTQITYLQNKQKPKQGQELQISEITYRQQVVSEDPTKMYPQKDQPKTKVNPNIGNQPPIHEPPIDKQPNQLPEKEGQNKNEH